MGDEAGAVGTDPCRADGDRGRDVAGIGARRRSVASAGAVRGGDFLDLHRYPEMAVSEPGHRESGGPTGFVQLFGRFPQCGRPRSVAGRGQSVGVPASHPVLPTQERPAVLAVDHVESSASRGLGSLECPCRIRPVVDGLRGVGDFHTDLLLPAPRGGAGGSAGARPASASQGSCGA